MKAVWALWRLWLGARWPSPSPVGPRRSAAPSTAPTSSVAIVVSVVLGGLVGCAGGRRVQLMRGAASIVVPRWSPCSSAAALGGRRSSAGRCPTPSFVADAVTTFLLVGLPAPGLDSLVDRHLVVLYPTMVARDVGVVPPPHARPPIAAPIVALGVIGLLVAPVGHGLVGAGRCSAAVIGAVLMVDVRNDLVSIPPLVGTGTELRRQLTWWRPLVQAVPALAALVVSRPRRADRRHLRHPPVRPPGHGPRRGSRARSRSRPAGASSTSPSRAPGSTSTGPARAGSASPSSTATATPAGSRPPSYEVTGDRFAADPVYPDRPPRRPPRVTGDGQRRGAAGFRALPSGGDPQRTDDPAGIRYSPAAGAISPTTAADGHVHRRADGDRRPPAADEPLVGAVPGRARRVPATRTVLRRSPSS